MGFQVSPGVAVREFDASGGIPAVSTTDTGIAAHLKWGPVQKRVMVDSEPTLVGQFGQPNANTYVDFFSAKTVLDDGQNLVVVRVVRESNTGTAATDTVTARNAQTNSANGKNTLIKNSDDYDANYSSGITGVGHWVAKYPGDLGNSLRISVCPSANAWQSTLTGTLTFTNNSTTVTGVGSSFTNQVRVGDILLAGPDKTQVKVASTTNATSLVLASKYVGNTAAGLTTTRRWEFFNSFDVAPGSSDYALVQAGSGDEMHIVIADEDGLWTGAANTVLEKYSKVSKAVDAKAPDGSGNYYVDVINQNSQFAWWAAALTGVTNAGKKVAGVSFGVGTQSRPINDSFGKGRDGSPPREADYINGLNKFANPEEVDISILVGGEASLTRALHLVTLTDARKDCVFTVSPLRASVVNNGSYAGKEVDDTLTHFASVPATSYGIADSGFQQIYDKYNDVYRYIPCSAAVAAAMIRTDTARDPWYSPAGYSRGQIKNTVRLAYNPTRQQRDALYKAGVNPIVTFPDQGTLLFGDKTLLRKESAFEQIGIRRLFIVLEKAIARMAKFLLFEFNDEFTRAQFRGEVEPFLRDVQGRRGIEAFRVKCDEENNTAEVRRQKRFVGSIFIKPNYSINFVELNFVAVRSDVEFTEVERF